MNSVDYGREELKRAGIEWPNFEELLRDTPVQGPFTAIRVTHEIENPARLVHASHASQMIALVGQQTEVVKCCFTDPTGACRIELVTQDRGQKWHVTSIDYEEPGHMRPRPPRAPVLPPLDAATEIAKAERAFSDDEG